MQSLPFESITIVPPHSRGWSCSPLRWSEMFAMEFESSTQRRELRSFRSSHPLHLSLLCAALAPLVRLVLWPSLRHPIAVFKGTFKRSSVHRAPFISKSPRRGWSRRGEHHKFPIYRCMQRDESFRFTRKSKRGRPARGTGARKKV